MKILKKEIKLSKLKLLQSSGTLSKKGFLFQISKTGFYIRIKRTDLSHYLKSNLSLNSIHNQDILVHLSQINFNLDGTITKTKYVGNGIFEIFIKFFDNVPQYWCDCLLDMLVSYPEGEFSKPYKV